jgi:chromosome segregation ATPase
MTRTLLLVLCLGLVAGGGHGAAAQEGASPPDVTPVLERIDGLSRSLDEIARSLRALLRTQNAQVLIRRIELEEGRLSPLDGELQQARGEVRAKQQEIARMEGIREALEKQIDDAVRAGADPQQMPERAELPRIDAMIELQREELGTAERRVMELEDDLATGRDRIAILDEQLQELLEAPGG